MADVKDTDFQILTVSSDEVKPGFSFLHLPENLGGKAVLELYSGNEEQSLRGEVEKRGGNYISLDFKNSVGDFSFIGNAEKTLPFLPDSFDYVLMSGPMVWRGDESIDVGKVVSLLKNSVRVFRKQPTNFIGALMHLDKANLDKVLAAISKDPAFDGFTPICENTGLPVLDKYSQVHPGQEYAFRLVVD